MVAELVGSEGVLSLHALIHGTAAGLFLLPGEGPPAALAEARALLADVLDHMEQVPECAFVVLRGAARETPVPADLLYDPTGLLHERLGDAGSCLCLIRPDGHLGFRSSPPNSQALFEYLGRLHGDQA